MLIKALRVGLGQLILLSDAVSRPRPQRRGAQGQAIVEKEAAQLSLYQFHSCPFCVKTRRALHRLNVPMTLHDAKNDPIARDRLLAGGGKITFNGYDAEHRIAAQLDGVQLTDEAAYKYVLTHSDLTLGPEATNLQLPAGDDATVKGKATTAKTASCDAQFVPLGD